MNGIVKVSSELKDLFTVFLLISYLNLIGRVLRTYLADESYAYMRLNVCVTCKIAPNNTFEYIPISKSISELCMCANLSTKLYNAQKFGAQEESTSSGFIQYLAITSNNITPFQFRPYLLL